MSSAASPSREVVGVDLIERAFVCPTGGGFEVERWLVQVNNGWMRVSALAWRRSVGNISAEVLDEDDPGKVGGARWSDRAPQQWFHRRTHVRAPIGTRFCRRTWRPVRDPNRLLEYPLPQQVIDDHFELRRSGLVPVRALEQRAAEREARQGSEAQPTLTKEENEAFAAELVARLDKAARERGAPPAEAEDDAPNETRPPRFRRPPVIDRRLTHPVEQPRKKGKIA
jgi:hypothetical protein